MRRATLVIALAGLGAALVICGRFARAVPQDQGVHDAAAIADAWFLPNARRDWHRVGAQTPERQPKVYVCSFGSSGDTYRELWNFYAEKCGLEKQYSEKELITVSGESKLGLYTLLERFDGENRSESIFSLRAERYVATVTLRPHADGKTVVGTLVVAVR